MAKAACFKDTDGKPMIMMVGSMKMVDGKRIKETQPVIVYSCMCKACMTVLDDYGLFG